MNIPFSKTIFANMDRDIIERIIYEKGIYRNPTFVPGDSDDHLNTARHLKTIWIYASSIYHINI